MTTITAPTLTAVNVDVYPGDAFGPGGYSVTPIWDAPGLDRPASGGICFTDRRLAYRLRDAMLAGAWFLSADIATDVNGKTYVDARGVTIGKYARRALDELGY